MKELTLNVIAGNMVIAVSENPRLRQFSMNLRRSNGGAPFLFMIGSRKKS